MRQFCLAALHHTTYLDLRREGATVCVCVRQLGEGEGGWERRKTAKGSGGDEEAEGKKSPPVLQPADVAAGRMVGVVGKHAGSKV
eukprot:528490-Prorocentrum_minimum.AAC.2